MIRHLLIIVAMIAASMSSLIWLCRAVDPSTRYDDEVEYNYARYCSGCHGAHGEGNGRIGRFKRLRPTNLTTTEFWAEHSDEQLIHSIAHGKDHMPAFSYYLTQEEQQDLLAFIKERFHLVVGKNGRATE
jgi:mono/diheme cytochrome c family protein